MDTKKVDGKRKDAKKYKSVTPSNEQTGWHRGGRTAIHLRHLPRLPLGNVGIEFISTPKHYSRKGG
jgi:hypothetical protein